MNALRSLGAACLLVGGALHTWLAFDGYGSDDLIAVFFLNGVASAFVAAALALGRGVLAPVAGVGVSFVSLVAFGLSRGGDGVLGFRGEGVDPAPEVLLTLVAEVAAVVVLATVVFGGRQSLLTTVRAAAERPGRGLRPGPRRCRRRRTTAPSA